MAVLQEKELQRFQPMRSLTMDALRELKRKTVPVQGARGSVLFTLRESRPEQFFLVEGSIRLQRSDGTGQTVSAGEPSAEQPVGADLQGVVTATALSAVRYFKIDADLLNVLHRPGAPTDYAVSELHADDDAPDDKLLFRIYQDYIDDKLDIPQVPEISLRVRRAIENPEVDIPKVARIIQADPALVARLVRVANSALYGGVAPVNNIREALVRLGLSVTRDLVTSFTLQNLFESDHRQVKQRILKVWQQSTMVAAVSFTLARLTRLYEPEHALLAGLLHDIGTATILRQADACDALVSDPTALEQVVVKLQGQVGEMVLEKWGFGEDLRLVARESQDWYREQTHHDLCDLVLVARLHAFDGELANGPELQFVPAYRRLGLDSLGESQRLKMLDDAKQEITEMRRLLLA